MNAFKRLIAVVAGAALLVTLPVTAPAWASDKYEKNEGAKLDAARRPSAGKALIYFVRPQFLGAAIKTKLYADGKFIGILGAKTFVAHESDPGRHVFAAVAENAGLLDAELAPDRIYFVQVAIHMGAWKARTHFEVVRKDSEALEEYLEAKADLVSTTTTPEGLQWVEEDAEADRRKMEKYRDSGEVETLKPEDGLESLP